MSGELEAAFAKAAELSGLAELAPASSSTPPAIPAAPSPA